MFKRMEHHILIDRQGQQCFLNKLLMKYKNEKADAALKAKISSELALEKHLGRLLISYKVVLRMDPSELFPPSIEVILDTKV